MINLDMSDKRPIYEQVVDRFKELISRGIIGKDEQLPSVRSLAMELSINPNTIQRAYSTLEHEGFVYVVKGRGNFAADITKLRPERRRTFFGELDALLGKMNDFSVTEEEIIEHIRTYGSKENKST